MGQTHGTSSPPKDGVSRLVRKTFDITFGGNPTAVHEGPPARHEPVFKKADEKSAFSTQFDEASASLGSWLSAVFPSARRRSARNIFIIATGVTVFTLSGMFLLRSSGASSTAEPEHLDESAVSTELFAQVGAEKAVKVSDQKKMPGYQDGITEEQERRIREAIRAVKGKKKLDYLIVHCTGGPPNSKCDMDRIDDIHRQRGFRNGIGYNFYINRFGELEFGRSLAIDGAHAPQVNDKSIAICLNGGARETGEMVWNPVLKKNVPELAPANNFTTLAMGNLAEFIRIVKSELPAIKIMGHTDLHDVNKACPSFSVKEFLLNNEI